MNAWIYKYFTHDLDYSHRQWSKNNKQQQDNTASKQDTKIKVIMVNESKYLVFNKDKYPKATTATDTQHSKLN